MKFLIILLALLFLLMMIRTRKQKQPTTLSWKAWVVIGVIALAWLVTMRFAVALGGKIFVSLLLLSAGGYAIWKISR